MQIVFEPYYIVRIRFSEQEVSDGIFQGTYQSLEKVIGRYPSVSKIRPELFYKLNNREAASRVKEWCCRPQNKYERRQIK